jgi:hypothetical protein
MAVVLSPIAENLHDLATASHELGFDPKGGHSHRRGIHISVPKNAWKGALFLLGIPHLYALR